MSDAPYYLTDGSHVLIAGATGAGERFGGKSVLANCWFTNAVESYGWDLGVYYNPKGLNYARGETVDHIKSSDGRRKGLADHYVAGKRLFDYRPGSDHELAHGRLVAFLKNLPGRKVIVHDEAQAYGGLESLEWCLSQGGNMANSNLRTGDIRSLLVTQRPWNLSERLRANCPLKIWVGPFGNEARRFFQAEQMEGAAEKVQEATGKYRWSVTDAGEYIRTHEPVPADFAR